jgi:RNA polymerase-binding transcription factor
MTPAQRKKYEQKLEALRAELRAEEPAKIEPNRKDPTNVGVADEDEQALSEMMQTLASQRNKKQAERLAQIDRALRRLRHEPDDFGLCEDCEEEIGDKRLRLMPFATLCLECQAKRDPKRGRSRHSLTDYK